MSDPSKHTLLVLASAALAFALERWDAQAATWALIVMAGSVGMWHGAADVVLLRSLSGTSSKTGAFIYSAVVFALVVALWAFAGVALAALLLLSAWHFGEAVPFAGGGRALATSGNQALIARGARGCAPLAAPLILSHAALAQTLRNDLGLSGSQWALAWLVWWVIAGLGVACALWMVLSLWIARGQSRRDPSLMPMRRWALADWLLCGLLNALLSPLLAFALYFGVHHAWPHLQRVLAAGGAQSFGATSVAWGAALAAQIAVAFWLLQTGSTAQLSTAALQGLVVVLAALTVPHAWVVHRWWRAQPQPPSP